MSTNASDPIDFDAEFLDSRDLIARIEYLEALDPESDADEIWETVDEFTALKALEAEARDYCPDWQYGETFVNETYFEEYAEEMAYDIGAIDREASWPLNRIDWEAAANDLRIDYTEYTLGASTFLAR